MRWSFCCPFTSQWSFGQLQPECVQDSRKESYSFRSTQNNLLATCLACYANVCESGKTKNYLEYCAIAQDKYKNIAQHNKKFEHLRKKKDAHEEKQNIYNGYDFYHERMSQASFDRDVIEKLEEADNEGHNGEKTA